MPNAFGFDASIGWVEEPTAWGTRTDPTAFQEFISEALKKTIERVESPSTRGLSETRRPDYLITCAGPTEFEGIYEGQGIPLKHSFGAVASAVEDVTAYKHTYTLADALPDGLTLTAYRGDDPAVTPQEHQYFGATVASITWTMNPNEALKVTYNWVAKDESLQALTTVTFPDLSGALLIKGHHMSCEFDDAVTVIDSAEVTLDNGLDVGKRVMGNQFIAQPVRSGRRKVTGTITKDWVSEAEYNLFVNGTATKLEFIFTSPTNIAGSSTPYSYSLIIPDGRFDGETPGVSSPAIVKQPLPFYALSGGTGTSDAIYAEVVNALTSI